MSVNFYTGHFLGIRGEEEVVGTFCGGTDENEAITHEFRVEVTRKYVSHRNFVETIHRPSVVQKNLIATEVVSASFVGYFITDQGNEECFPQTVIFVLAIDKFEFELVSRR